MNKKGFTLWEIIVMAIVILIVGGILIFVFNRLFGEEAKNVEGQIGKLGDADKDGVIDTFDRCKDTSHDLKADSKGCAPGQLLDK